MAHCWLASARGECLYVQFLKRGLGRASCIVAGQHPGVGIELSRCPPEGWFAGVDGWKPWRSSQRTVVGDGEGGCGC